MRPVSLGSALPACLLALAAAAVDDDRAIRACRDLQRALPGGVALRNTTGYASHSEYWSNRQAEARPCCFVAPRSTRDVSRVMRRLTAGKVPFTVRAGGHTAFEGGSSIDGGVTVDLVHLDSIAVSPDRATASVGPGNRWIDVSEALDPMGLAVVGGRAADVGVSGLLLGGGLSYFSGTRGWACDNVRRYELVVSSGRVVEASPAENPDLYWALRGGGGSNFGIVTRFDLVAFPQRELWANSIVFPGEQNRTLVPLFTHLANTGLVDAPEAHAYFVLSYQALLGGFVALTSLFQSAPPPRNTTPPVFRPFQAVPGAISNETRLAGVSAQSRAIVQPSGSRQTWWDTSVDTASTELFEAIVSLYEAHVNRLLAAANGTQVVPYLVFQPISQNVVREMQKNGGNALGLKPERGPLMIVQLTTTWSDRRLDALVESSSEAFIGQVEHLSNEMGLYRGFVYMNYAGKTQDVLARYGPESHRRLTETAAKWDPEGHLQELWRGYFQLQGPRSFA